MTGTALPASFHQESLFSAVDGGLSVCNLTLAVPVETGAGAVQDAVFALAQRHEALRTTLGRVGTGVVQVVGEPGWFVDRVEAGQAEERLPDLLRSLASRPFHLDGGPLVRAVLVERRPRPTLLLVVHHAVGDAASMAVLGAELGPLLAGRPLEPVGAGQVQMADYAAWERVEPDPARVDWWSDYLHGSSTLVDGSDACQESALLTASEVSVPHGVTSEDLRRAAAHHRVQPTALIAAAARRAVSRLAPSGDLVVGVMRSNRDRPSLRQTFGFLAGHLPVRVPLSGDLALDLAATQVSYADAAEHAVHVGHLRSLLSPDRSRVFDVAVNYRQGAAPPDVSTIEVPPDEVTEHPWWQVASRCEFHVQALAGRPLRIAVLRDARSVDDSTADVVTEAFIWALRDLVGAVDNPTETERSVPWA